FGGGIGRAGCVCGALSGAVMAIGLRCGRTTPDVRQRDQAYARAERLWRRFVERAGGEDCRDINTLGFSHPDHKSFCARFVAIAAELAAEEIAGGT
ncbi:MAG: C-GCAxxG-C-C family protein, partial [Anaerolineae bacterium]|nr:C-GCAxxG-C-C family protein [Anaerolineae bacterium]